MKAQDEQAFTPLFLASLSVQQLVVLQHELRQFTADKPYLRQVLDEITRRDTARTPA